MKRRASTAGIAALTAILLSVPATAGTQGDPEITDPAGDANFISPITGIQEDTRPASFDNLDLRAVWFETAYETNKVLDPDTGEVLRVEFVPTDFLIHIETEAPLRPLDTFATVVYKVQAQVPECHASFELWAFTDPESDRAEIRRAGSGAAPCADLAIGEIVRSPVKPAFDGTVATLTFPLSDQRIQRVISAGHGLSEPGALVDAKPPTIPFRTADDTAVGRTFTIGQDVPPNVDCTADPGHTECQP